MDRPLLETEWIFEWIYSIEIVWIYYEFSGAIANLIVWISQFFSQ
jgi:hypothetical protein